MIFERVRKIIANILKIKNLQSITLESILDDDLKADSLDALEIIMAIEDAFSIEIPDEEVERFRNVSDLVSFIEKLK